MMAASIASTLQLHQCQAQKASEEELQVNADVLFAGLLYWCFTASQSQVTTPLCWRGWRLLLNLLTTALNAVEKPCNFSGHVRHAVLPPCVCLNCTTGRTF